MKVVHLLVFMCCLASISWAKPVPTQSFDGLPPACLDLLTRADDASGRYDFDEAEKLAQEAVTQWPEAPLPRIFWQAILNAEGTEILFGWKKDKAALWRRMEKADQESVAVAEARARNNPGACADFYLGGSLGSRAMNKLVQSRYLSAFFDGKKAYKYLQKAVKEDPELKDAYFGLGLFEYEFGRMPGIFRFTFGLKGDVNKGLADIETAAREGTFAARAAALQMAIAYTFDLKDYEKGYPWVRQTYAAYPSNTMAVGLLLTNAHGLGFGDPRAQKAVEEVSARWDEGYRPPSYIPKDKFDFESLRLDLAKEYLKEGKKDLAQPHLKALEASARWGKQARSLRPSD
jgi:hypothetical protein